MSVLPENRVGLTELMSARLERLEVVAASVLRRGQGLPPLYLSK
jgi:hypothetical protein